MGIKERWNKCAPLPAQVIERLNHLNPFLENEQVLLVYLFGSLIRQRSGEDIDLAILPGEEDLGSLREKIHEILGTERVDLVNLKTAPPFFALR